MYSVQDWSPHMSFILKGSQIWAIQLKGSFKTKTSIQEYRNANTKLILKLCMNYVVHVSSTMWRIKNQPSNYTTYSDNALHLLVLVTGRLYWGLQVTSSFSIWGCTVKGCFEVGVFWRAKSRLQDFEDFNLEHCQCSKGLSFAVLYWSPHFSSIMQSGNEAFSQPHPPHFSKDSQHTSPDKYSKQRKHDKKCTPFSLDFDWEHKTFRELSWTTSHQRSNYWEHDQFSSFQKFEVV